LQDDGVAHEALVHVVPHGLYERVFPSEVLDFLLEFDLFAVLGSELQVMIKSATYRALFRRLLLGELELFAQCAVCFDLVFEILLLEC